MEGNVLNSSFKNSSGVGLILKLRYPAICTEFKVLFLGIILISPPRFSKKPAWVSAVTPSVGGVVGGGWGLNIKKQRMAGGRRVEQITFGFKISNRCCMSAINTAWCFTFRGII